MKKINGKKLSSKMLKAVERIAKEGLLPNFIKAVPTANKKISKLPVLEYPEELNPFRSALCKIRLNEYENMKLNEFLEKTIAARNVNELSKVIDEALDLYQLSQITRQIIHRANGFDRTFRNISNKFRYSIFK